MKSALNDPPPPNAADAAKAPEIEKQILDDPAYAPLWSSGDLNTFLTGLGQALINEGPKNTTTSQDFYNFMKKRKGLLQLFSEFVQYESRTGAFPADFVTRLDAYLLTLEEQPHLGLWTSKYDFSATAYAAHLNRPDYLREFIAARTEGPYKWVDQESPYRVYFARERAALERVGQLAPLTPVENERLAKLRLSPFSDEYVQPVDLGTLLAAYHDNELRADSKYKDQAIQTTGVVGDVRQGAVSGIMVTLTKTTASFGEQTAICSFEDSESNDVSKLSRGQHVTIQAVVRGLVLEDVMLAQCALTSTH